MEKESGAILSVIPSFYDLHSYLDTLSQDVPEATPTASEVEDLQAALTEVAISAGLTEVPSTQRGSGEGTAHLVRLADTVTSVGEALPPSPDEVQEAGTLLAEDAALRSPSNVALAKAAGEWCCRRNTRTVRGGPTLVLRAMTVLPREEGVQEAGACALAALCGSVENRKEALQVRGVEVLTAASVAFFSNARLGVFVVRALSSLCMDSAGRAVVTSSEGRSTITMLLNRLVKSPLDEVQEGASICLWHLSLGSVRESASLAAAMWSELTAALSSSRSSLCVSFVCAALGNLAIPSAPTLVHQDAAAAVLSTLSSHPMDHQVQEQALRAASVLKVDSEGAAERAGAALRSFLKHPQVLVQACLLLCEVESRRPIYSTDQGEDTVHPHNHSMYPPHTAELERLSRRYRRLRRRFEAPPSREIRSGGEESEESNVETTAEEGGDDDWTNRPKGPQQPSVELVSLRDTIERLLEESFLWETTRKRREEEERKRKEEEEETQRAAEEAARAPLTHFYAEALPEGRFETEGIGPNPTVSWLPEVSFRVCVCDSREMFWEVLAVMRAHPAELELTAAATSLVALWIRRPEGRAAIAAHPTAASDLASPVSQHTALIKPALAACVVEALLALSNEKRLSEAEREAAVWASAGPATALLHAACGLVCPVTARRALGLLLRVATGTKARAQLSVVGTPAVLQEALDVFFDTPAVLREVVVCITLLARQGPFAKECLMDAGVVAQLAQLAARHGEEGGDTELHDLAREAALRAVPWGKETEIVKLCPGLFDGC